MRTVTIVQGEQKVICEPDVLISTLLGSCIAVCLHDAEARIGGMNHFLLGEPGTEQTVTPQDMQRYGIHAMELLINGMMRAGASRNRMRAHIYGGANIIAGLGNIGSKNAAFTDRFMATEGIAVGHRDVGGNQPRKVEFLPWEGKVRAIKVKDIPHAPPRVAKPQVCEVELF